MNPFSLFSHAISKKSFPSVAHQRQNAVLILEVLDSADILDRYIELYVSLFKIHPHTHAR